MVEMYQGAVDDLRFLLSQLGRQEFRAYGYPSQLRRYRAIVRGSGKAG